MSKFEKFIYKRMQAPGDPLITISKSGSINFNIATMEKYVKDYKYVILFFNKEDILIGIEVTNKKSPEAYAIRKYRDSKFGTISGVAFLKYYDIHHDETLSYSVKWDEEKNMMIIDLNEHFEREETEMTQDDDELPLL